MHAIKFKKRSDRGPLLVGPFPTEQTAREHLSGLANRYIVFKAQIIELVGWKESLEWCDGNDPY